MFPLLIYHEVYIFLLTFFENYSNLNFSGYLLVIYHLAEKSYFAGMYYQSRISL
jgi:hypothetical protein